MEKFKDWLKKKFSNLNPFNWELPSWLGGGTIGSNTQQVKNAETAGVFLPTDIPPAIKEPENIPEVKQPAVNAQPKLQQIVQRPQVSVSSVVSVPAPTVQLAPVVNVAPIDPTLHISQNIPVLQSLIVSVAQIDTTDISNSLADIDRLLSNVVGRDIEVRSSITSNPAPSSP